MPLDEQGAKWACEPCIRGHRSSKCEHFDRLMVKVAKAGRPLMKCPHPGQTCDCRKKYALMVRIPKGASCFCRPVYEVSSASKIRGPPAIPHHVMLQATRSKPSNGLEEAAEEREIAHSHYDVRCRNSNNLMQEKRPPIHSCCVEMPSPRNSSEEEDKRTASYSTERHYCSAEKSTKRKLSILNDSGCSSIFLKSNTLLPRAQLSKKRNRVSRPDMPSTLLQEPPENKHYDSSVLATATTSAIHPESTSAQSLYGPVIIGSQQSDLSNPPFKPSGTALATPQASYCGTPTWLSGEHCHCGDECQCLGCGTHPYNQATLQTVQAMGNIIFTENTLPAENLDTSALASSLTELNQQQVCATMPPYTSDSQATIPNNHLHSTDSPPDYMTKLPMTYDFDIRLAPSFAYSFPDNNNDLVTNTTSNSTPHMYDVQSNFIQDDSTDVVMFPNAYWQFEYPLQLANPCTNALGGCKCGENCLCVGCLTHTGHYGVPMSFPSKIEGTNLTMAERVAGSEAEHSSRYTPVFHDVAATFPVGGDLVGLGLSVPQTTQSTDTSGHCSATIAERVKSPSNPATVSGD